MYKVKDIMIKYDVEYGPSIFIFFLVLIVFGVHELFADDKFEFSPYMDFNGSIHGGIGSHYDGFAASAGAGAEFLYVVNDNFAFGVNGKTNLNYDNYLSEGPVDDDVIVDEYGTWTLTFGGIVYMGEMLYMAYMAIYHVDTFHESTYLSCSDGDIEQKKLQYTVDEFNYLLEIGLRLSYHMSVYADITTHLVETKVDQSKYQIYLGLKYHI